MSSLPSLTPGDFPTFFRAVHGYDPFPWQGRLLRQVVTIGWPKVLDLPTGTGKTAVLDVSVFALALGAGGGRRSAPLRIVYVVDRRTIVDQAHERAKTICKKIASATDDILRRVRNRLAGYTGEDVALQTTLLRGGIARDDSWARTPDQPLIVVSTVDQAGSRLLFRGYGVADSMKPVHAGLLGNDVLYLLDEVHLSQPFRETLDAIHTRYRTWAEQPLPSPFVVVEMSATPGSSPADTFRLDEADRRHTALAARLRSSKPAILVSTNAKGFPKEIEKHVLSMLERPGATVAVVVNRVKSARDIHSRLRDAVTGRSIDVQLLTGRMRPFDRDTLEGNLLKRVRAGRNRSLDDRPVVVVATQSIEAGADFDFDGLVTECASLDALRQRFGRLDRLGALADAARGAIVARTDTLKDDPVYGDAIGRTWDWLQTVADGQTVDFGIEALNIPPDALDRELLAPKNHSPILLPSHLDAWVQTAPIPEPDPDVALWLHGPQRGAADVQVIWRADLTEDLLKQGVDGDSASTEVAIGMVEALPPVSAEAMSVPFLAAKRWLEGRSEPESFDVEGAVDEDEEALDQRLELPPRPAILWLGEHSTIIRGKDLRPGQTIVVPSSYGGIGDGNWNPTSREPVQDVAELAVWNHRKPPAMRLHTAVVRGLFGRDLVVPTPAIEEEVTDSRDAVKAWLEGQRSTITNGRLRELLDWLAEDNRLRVEQIRTVSEGDDDNLYFFVSGKRRPPASHDDTVADDRVTADESKSSFTGVAVTLSAHLAGVAEVASGFAERVGLPDHQKADLGIAAVWHDAGKADLRFQRWLHGGSEFKALVQPEPLAKGTARLSNRLALSRARERAGYPAGYRHELMSLALMEPAADALAKRARDWELVQHLIASHHGHCRPFAPWVPDPNPIDVAFSYDGITCSGSSAHELARLDSGVAERFWQMVRRYGWWGLAWLEAMLRLADHRRSEREQSAQEQPNA